MRTILIASLLLIGSVSIALGKKPAKKSGDDAFKKLDVNGDSKLSLHEFVHGKADAAAAEKEFAAKDKDKDGFLSESEFKGSTKKKKKK